MSDYNSQLPIRSEADGTDERVLVKIQDGDNPGGANETATVSEKKVHTRGHGKDSDGTDQETLHSQEGHLLTNGDYDATNNKRPSSQGVIASDRDASPSETTMNKRPTAVAGNDDKVALDVAISDSSGNRFDENNPLPVFQTANPGDEVNNYDQAVDTASDGSTNHDYTIAATSEFRQLKVSCSASGKARFELQIETGIGAGTFTTAQVCFNSTANPNCEMSYEPAVQTGRIIRVVKTNLDNQPQDVYTTIKGIEV